MGAYNVGSVLVTIACGTCAVRMTCECGIRLPQSLHHLQI